MNCLDTKEKCTAFSVLMDELYTLEYAIDFSNGDDCAVGFNPKNNNLWIMLDCDYRITMFTNINLGGVHYCWTNFDTDKEYFADNFDDIYNIALSYQ
jgi:hypothetical protein